MKTVWLLLFSLLAGFLLQPGILLANNAIPVFQELALEDCEGLPPEDCQEEGMQDEDSEGSDEGENPEEEEAPEISE